MQTRDVGPDVAHAFRRDPIAFLDRVYPASGHAFWLPGRQLCLAEPEAARAVLTNAEGLFEEHSDFFFTRKGIFGPRRAQEQIGRGSRSLLRDFLADRSSALEESVERHLVPTSDWPDAGNRLIFDHLAEVLLSPESPEVARRTLGRIVERAVMAGAPTRHSAPSRLWFRLRMRRHLGREIRRRLALANPGSAPGRGPEDLLGVVLEAAGGDVPESQLLEVFLSFVFAIAGSVAFSLGWSLLLLGSHRTTNPRPAWVAREALRLWPVAWMLGRRPKVRQEVAGVEVGPDDAVTVCPYLVHRNPDHWPEPTRFQPERWSRVQRSQAYLPFGWGPHTCVAASLSLRLVEEVLEIVQSRFRLEVREFGARPHMGPALAPPRFRLTLGTRSKN